MYTCNINMSVHLQMYIVSYTGLYSCTCVYCRKVLSARVSVYTVVNSNIDQTSTSSPHTYQTYGRRWRGQCQVCREEVHQVSTRSRLSCSSRVGVTQHTPSLLCAKQSGDVHRVHSGGTGTDTPQPLTRNQQSVVQPSPSCYPSRHLPIHPPRQARSSQND